MSKQKSCYLYLAHLEESHYYKIGISSNPERRCDDFSKNSAKEVCLLGKIAFCGDDSRQTAATLEKITLKRLGSFQIKGEWLVLPPLIAKDIESAFNTGCYGGREGVAHKISKYSLNWEDVDFSTYIEQGLNFYFDPDTKDYIHRIPKVWERLKCISQSRPEEWLTARVICQQTILTGSTDNTRKIFEAMAKANFGEISGEGKGLKWRYQITN